MLVFPSHFFLCSIFPLGFSTPIGEQNNYNLSESCILSHINWLLL